MKQTKAITTLAIFGLLSITLFSGCKDEEPEAVQLPENLVVSVTQDGEEEGLVKVEAKADFANFYTITFTEGEEQTIEESGDGKASYTYSASGSYSINVKAHATGDDFIETNETVVISIGLPGNNGTYPENGFSSPLSYPGYTLVWQDEFEGTSLSSNWNFEIGAGGWGNQELQYYTENNATVADGFLTIEARKEFFNGSQFTSSRITTEGNQEFKYGRIDIRAALPFGQGIWPAFWMLGANFSTEGWPKCGEIDIMEMVGGDITPGGNNTTFGTIHWDNGGTKADFGGYTSIPSGALADEFHVYSIIWDSNEIKWLLDDEQFHAADITPADLSEFHDEFFFIFNIAVGGEWPGSPDQSTIFPQRLFVDYIRVFQE